MSGILAGLIGSYGAAVPDYAYELISTSLVSSNVTTLTISSLPTTGYKHLEVRFTARNGTASNTNLRMTLNGSSTGYAYHQLYGNGTSVTSFASSANTYVQFREGIVSNVGTAGAYSAGVISILDYMVTSIKSKTIRASYGSNPNPQVALLSGLWTSTAAVTSMSFTVQSGTIGIGSRFSVYGIKG